MSGYFAQLMQQTGLVSAAAPLQPPSDAGGGEAAADLEVNVIQPMATVEHPPAERPEIGRAIAPDHAQPFPQPKLPPLEVANPLDPLGKTTELIEFNLPPMPSPPSPLEELASIQRTGTDSASPDSGPPTPPADPAPVRLAWAPPPPYPPSGLEQKTPVEIPLPQLTQVEPLPQIAQVDLQTVWDWVAKNPTPAPQSPELELERGAIAPWTAAKPSGREDPSVSPLAPPSGIPSTASPAPLPNQDLHLSIGSITVSLEAPPPPPIPAAPLSPSAPPAGDPARFDRHYLRL